MVGDHCLAWAPVACRRCLNAFPAGESASSGFAASTSTTLAAQPRLVGRKPKAIAPDESIHPIPRGAEPSPIIPRKRSAVAESRGSRSIFPDTHSEGAYVVSLANCRRAPRFAVIGVCGAQASCKQPPRPFGPAPWKGGLSAGQTLPLTRGSGAKRRGGSGRSCGFGP